MSQLLVDFVSPEAASYSLHGMAGRGGRGQALWEALSQPVRKPGVVTPGAAATEAKEASPPKPQVQHQAGWAVVVTDWAIFGVQVSPVLESKAIPAPMGPAGGGFPIGRGARVAAASQGDRMPEVSLLVDGMGHSATPSSPPRWFLSHLEEV